MSMTVKGFDPALPAERGISQALASGRFPHALIIEGASPEERMALALKTAKALVCSDKDEIPCGRCSACIKAAAKSHPDIPVYSVEDKPRAFKVDMVREIRSSAYIVPNEADRKVFILENAHTMGPEGQNALLKILEEPPAYVVFILLCPSSTGFLPTVLSRATVFSLGEVERETDKDELAAAKEAARAFAVSLASFEDMETVKAAAAFEKDQRLLRDAMPIIQEILGQALRVKCSAPEETEFAEEARLIASKLTKNALLSAVEGLDALMAAAALNANHNLMVTRLCTLLRRQAGR